MSTLGIAAGRGIGQLFANLVGPAGAAAVSGANVLTGSVKKTAGAALAPEVTAIAETLL